MKLNRRTFLAGLGGAGWALANGAFARADEEAPRPNIILCMTDDQGWGDVSYNGLKEIQTRNLDEMAAGGLRMNRFYAAAPVCSPTRGSVLTGRHPCRYGTFQPGKPIRIEEQTIAQALKAAGYVTGHFGKWHLNGVSGPGKPLKDDDPLNPGKLGFDEWLSVSNYFERDWTFGRNGKGEEKLPGDGSEAIVAEALKFVDRAAAAKKPFLAVVWFGSPHDPHDPLPEDRQAGGAYYGEILGVDRAMGSLRAGLRAKGVAENTLLWFNSDNGPKRGSTGGLRGKKGSLWEGGVRVPGLAEWPARIKKGSVTGVPAVTSDLYPTLLELAGAKVKDQVQPLDGLSLVPLLDGKMAERPAEIGFWDGSSKITTDLNSGHAAWTGNRFKLHKLEAGTFELYDLEDDPTESKDLAAAKPELVQAMKTKLSAWQESVVKSLKRGDYAAKGR